MKNSRIFFVHMFQVAIKLNETLSFDACQKINREKQIELKLNIRRGSKKSGAIEDKWRWDDSSFRININLLPELLKESLKGKSLAEITGDSILKGIFAKSVSQTENSGLIIKPDKIF